MRAVALGADAVELDVHATRDEFVVVHHDPIPRAKTPHIHLAGKPISDLTLEQLETFTIGADVRIPTLASVLEDLGGRVDAYVEMKGARIERLVVDAILASPAPRKCGVHGFDHRSVRRVKELAPQLRTGILMYGALVAPAAALQATGATDFWAAREFLDSALVYEVHRAGGRVIAWTVNDPAEARDFEDLGVDGICTDLLPTIRAGLLGAPGG